MPDGLIHLCIFEGDMMKKYLPFILLIHLVFLLACQTDNIGNTAFQYVPPIAINDGIAVSTLEEEVVNESLIAQMMDDINNGVYGEFNALLLFVGDHLVLEEYFNEYTVNTKHKIFSVTKSLTSALVGIAIDHELLENDQQLIRQYLPQYEYIDWDEEKELININHLLTMTAGFSWDELSTPFTDPGNSHYQMLQQADWNDFVLGKTMVDMPGYQFVYNTGAVNLLAPVLEHMLGYELENFADSLFFNPLGIEDYNWIVSNKGYPATGGSLGGIMMRPRDMAKFGMLYMNEGVWEDQQVVSEDWINQSLMPLVPLDNDEYYGLLWWIKPAHNNDGEKIYLHQAVGYAGQYIVFSLDMDFMIVITSYNPADFLTPYTIIEDYIIPAIQ